jgi:hypothetical protein
LKEGTRCHMCRTTTEIAAVDLKWCSKWKAFPEAIRKSEGETLIAHISSRFHSMKDLQFMHN